MSLAPRDRALLQREKLSFEKMETLPEIIPPLLPYSGRAWYRDQEACCLLATVVGRQMVGMGSSGPIDPSAPRLLSEPDIGCQRGRKKTKTLGHQGTLTASLSLSRR